MQYAVFVGDQLVGGAGGFALESVEAGAVELGWWLNPTHWGRGITTVAVQAVIDEFFGGRGFVRLWAPVMRPNVGSARVAEKAGTKLEGIAPQHYIKHGVRHDQMNFGITLDDWRTKRGIDSILV